MLDNSAQPAHDAPKMQEGLQRQSVGENGPIYIIYFCMYGGAACIERDVPSISGLGTSEGKPQDVSQWVDDR